MMVKEPICPIILKKTPSRHTDWVLVYSLRFVYSIKIIFRVAVNCAVCNW